MLKLSFEKPKKKSGKYSKFIIMFTIFALILFTWRVLNVFEITGSEPSATVVAVYAFGANEMWQLAKIKKEKERTKRYDQGTIDSENYE